MMMLTWEQAYERIAVFPEHDRLRLRLEAAEHLGSPPPVVGVEAGRPVLEFPDRKMVLRESGVFERGE